MSTEWLRQALNGGWAMKRWIAGRAAVGAVVIAACACLSPNPAMAQDVNAPAAKPDASAQPGAHAEAKAEPIPAPAPEPDRGLPGVGIRCPNCWCRDLRTTHTRPIPGNRIRRYRRCRHCGKKVVSTEKLNDQQI